MDDLNDKVNNGGASAAGKLFYNEWNQVASELQSLIVDDGTTLAPGTLTQALAAIAQLARGRSWWCTDSGSSSAYVLTGVSSASVTLFTGMTVKFRPANNSTVTAPTANFNGSGAKTIKNEAGSALVVGDLSTLRDAELRYDGTNWRLLNRCLTLTQTGLYNKGYINGFYLQNDGVAPLTTVSIGAGDAANTDATLNLILAVTFKKRLDAVWAVGSASIGGRASNVSLSNNTYYRLFVIGGASAVTDAGFDTSSVAANLLADATIVSGNTYDKYRQIGWVLTNGSAQIVKFFMDTMDYSKILWDVPYKDVDVTNSATTRQTPNITAPPSSIANIIAWIGGPIGSSADYFLDVRPTALGDQVPAVDNFVAKLDNLGNTGGASDSTWLEIVLDASRQLAWRITGGGATTNIGVVIITRGYRYIR